MKKVRLWMLTAILTLCGTTTVSAQTKQGEWFSSGSIGVGLSNFVGDIKDNKSKVGITLNGDIGYNVTDWFAPSIGITNAYQSVGYTVINKSMHMDVLSVPLLLNCSTGPFTLKAGIQPDFMLSARMNGLSYRDQFKTVSMSVPLALNWNFCKDSDGDLWFVEVRYHLGLTKMNKEDMFSNGWRTPGSIRNSIIMLNIGYKCDL
jgi:hypothetical protein